MTQISYSVHETTNITSKTTDQIGKGTGRKRHGSGVECKLGSIYFIHQRFGVSLLQDDKNNI